MARLKVSRPHASRRRHGIASSSGMQDAELAMETDEETGTARCGREPLVVPHLFLVLECGRPWAGGARHDLAGIDQILIGRGPKRSVSRSLASGLRVLELHVPDRHMSQ